MKEMDVTLLDPYEILDVDAEQEPDQTDKITSTEDVVVKDVHDYDLGNNLNKDDEGYRI